MNRLADDDSDDVKIVLVVVMPVTLSASGSVGDGCWLPRSATSRRNPLIAAGVGMSSRVARLVGYLAAFEVKSRHPWRIKGLAVRTFLRVCPLS